MRPYEGHCGGAQLPRAQQQRDGLVEGDDEPSSELGLRETITATRGVRGVNGILIRSLAIDPS